MPDTPELASLVLPHEAREYDSRTKPPAPDWLVTSTPGTGPLVEALDAATAKAKDAEDAHRAAVLAFRAASNPNSGSWEPKVDIAYEEWRQLKAKQGEAERLVRESSRPVKAAWLELRKHLLATPEATAEANRMADSRAADLRASVESLESVVRRFEEANALTPTAYARREDRFAYNIGSELRKTARELLALVGQGRQ